MLDLRASSSWRNTASLDRVLIDDLSPVVNQQLRAYVTFINGEKVEKDFTAVLDDMDPWTDVEVEFHAVVPELDESVVYFQFHLLPQWKMILLRHVNLQLEWRRRQVTSNLLQLLEQWASRHGFRCLAIDLITSRSMAHFAVQHGFQEGSSVRATRQVRHKW